MMVRRFENGEEYNRAKEIEEEIICFFIDSFMGSMFNYTMIRGDEVWATDAWENYAYTSSPFNERLDKDMKEKMEKLRNNSFDSVHMGLRPFVYSGKDLQYYVPTIILDKSDVETFITTRIANVFH